MKLKKYLKNTVKNLLIYSLLLILPVGCSQESPQDATTKSPIEYKLIRIFKDEYKLDIVARITGKTLWIYIPLEQDILSFDRAKTLFEEDKTQKFNVRYITGNYKSQIFDFKFYIDENPDLPKMKDVFEGITYTLTDKTTEISMHAYHYMEELAWGYIDEVESFVLVIADIKRGIEYTQIINALDLKKSSMNSIPSDEFSKRTISNVRGHYEIVDDKKGIYLKYKNITIQDFIIQQVISRVKMDMPAKYTIISTADINKIILETLWQATKNYNFEDFLMVKISNMVSGDEISYSRLALEERFKQPSGENSI